MATVFRSVVSLGRPSGRYGLFHKNGLIPIRHLSSANSQDIRPAEIMIERTKSPKPLLPKEKLMFGQTMSDHMLDIDWDKDSGWHSPRIVPYQPIPLDPAASSLHYGLECFEGMKAYLDDQGKVRLFRPELNMQRLRRSMERLALPTFDTEALLQCIMDLVMVDKRWIPVGDGYSLYLRPTAISTHPFLGVGTPSAAKIYVILSPVGPYYKEGFKPVKLLAEERFARAWQGGTGNYKVGGNYAPTILPQKLANDKGYSQVLWLSGPDKAVTEVGTMNMFVLWKNEEGDVELVTAPLERGDILPGVTRQSVLDLCREWGDFKVSERTFTMDELALACVEGRVIEAFGTGTACVISPIQMINYKGQDFSCPLELGGSGALTKKLWDKITDIQYGRCGDHPWSVVVDEHSSATSTSGEKYAMAH